MSQSDRSAPCRNCGREYPADRLDPRRWCPLCRREVIRRATRAARTAAVIATVALMLFMFATVGPSPRFLIGWLVLLGVTYVFVYKLGQRVAFEVIRGRGVPPPEA